MKYTILLLVVLMQMRASGQQLKATVKDTLPARAALKTNVPNRKTTVVQPLEVTIENELGTILSAYTSQPNTAATWMQVKAAAENILYTYFLGGKLLGTKAEQAFFVKMGTETMTVTDIANKKMILIAGIATVKPAEFVVIRVEKTCTK